MNYLYPVGYFAANLILLTFYQSIFYYHQHHDTSVLPWMGVIMFAGTFLQAFAFLIGGVLCDRIYHRGIQRKKMLLVVLMFYGVSFVFIWLTTGWLHVVIILLFVMAAAIALQLYLSILPGLSSDPKVKQRLSMLIGLAMVFSTTFVITISPKLLGYYSINHVIYLLMMVWGLCYVLPIFLCREEKACVDDASNMSYGIDKSIWQRHGYVTVILISFILNIAVVSLVIILPHFAATMLDKTPDYYLKLGGFFFLGAILVAAVLTRSIEPKVIANIAGFSCLLAGVGIVVAVILKLVFDIIFLPTWWFVFFLFGVVNVSAVTVLNLTLAMFSQHDKLLTSGRLFSLNSAAFVLGNGVGMLLSGSLLTMQFISMFHSVVLVISFVGLVFISLIFLLKRDFYKAVSE